MNEATEIRTGAYSRKRDWFVAVVLVGCMGLLALWQIAAFMASKDGGALNLTSSDFAGFAPVLQDWRIESLPVGSDPLEPNILAYKLVPVAPAAGRPVLVRLVHGYNTKDCMRIKGYTVTLVSDAGSAEVTGGPGLSGRLQGWRVTAPDGRTAMWGTRMIRAYDFSLTGESVTSMAFPKVGTPDDPNWLPRGLTWSSLRHPVRNFRVFMRAKWNSSRCDPLTFLGLKRPAWASDQVLTVVGSSLGAPVPPEDEAAVAAAVREALDGMLVQFRRWRLSNPDGAGQGEQDTGKGSR